MSTPLRQPEDSPIKPRVPPKIDVPPPRQKVVASPGREQEQSIRERKQLLFEEDELSSRPIVEERPIKSFPEYLRTTPAAPLSGMAKALLWGIGILVVLLFVATLAKSGNRPGRSSRGAPPASSRAK